MVLCKLVLVYEARNELTKRWFSKSRNLQGTHSEAWQHPSQNLATQRHSLSFRSYDVVTARLQRVPVL